MPSSRNVSVSCKGHISVCGSEGMKDTLGTLPLVHLTARWSLTDPGSQRPPCMCTLHCWEPTQLSTVNTNMLCWSDSCQGSVVLPLNSHVHSADILTLTSHWKLAMFWSPRQLGGCCFLINAAQCPEYLAIVQP